MTFNRMVGLVTLMIISSDCCFEYYVDLMHQQSVLTDYIQIASHKISYNNAALNNVGRQSQCT